MTFRKLIERAMYETCDEFARLVDDKLERLLHDGSEPIPIRRGRPPAVPLAPLATQATQAVRANRDKEARQVKQPEQPKRPPAPVEAPQLRASPDHMSRLQSKVLNALSTGAPMKKSEIMKSARLSEEEDARVGIVLIKLRNTGRIDMSGERGLSTYVLKA